MKQLILFTFALAMVRCSSPAPQTQTHDAPAMPSIDAPEAKVDETSDVLARKDPNAKKCPKKAKLVKGKCLMQVEETE